LGRTYSDCSEYSVCANNQLYWSKNNREGQVDRKLFVENKCIKLTQRMDVISTNVNMLRFLAAILVIFSHSFYVANMQDDPLAKFCGMQTNLGGVAVAVFFFLSGFYVTKSLYKRNNVKEYLYKRCLRIFPQLWITIFLSVFVLGPILTTYSLNRYFMNGGTYLYLLNAILFPIHNLPGVFEGNIYDASVNGALWTLPVEFIAYCVLAVIMVISKKVLKKENSQKVFHIISIVVLLIVFVFVDVVLKNDFLITAMRPLIIFFVGVLYYDYAEKIKLCIPVACGMVLFMVFCCIIPLLNYALIFCLPYVIITFSLGMKQIRVKEIVKISYEMYLLGWPIQQSVVCWFGGTMNPYLNFLIVLPIDIILGYILFACVEKVEKSAKSRITCNK